MKFVGITQRVEVIESYNERRDCLDQRWSELADRLGFYPVPIPNLKNSQIQPALSRLNLDAIIFSGGNSLTRVDPSAKDGSLERDTMEATLFEYAANQNIPILGVCRGMQFINVELGGSLSPIKGHVASIHALKSNDPSIEIPADVNSFHNWAISPEDLAKGLVPVAFDSEGYIEAFRAPDRRIFGIMWHPERETPVGDVSKQLIESILS